MIKMNRFTSVTLIALAGASFTPAAFAQNEPAAPEVPATPAVSDAELVEMLGYLTVFQSGMKELGFTPEDAPAIARGITRGLGDAEPDQAMLAKMPAFQEFIQVRAEKAQAAAAIEAEKSAAGNIAAAESFFSDLVAEGGVESTASGLHYKVIEPGEGDKPTMEDTVLVHYKGTLIDGTQFDSSYDRGDAATFPLNGVVAGFGEGLTKIAPGGKIILYIPSEIGYGNNPRPGGAIKPGDTLIFECELIEVNPGS